MSKKVVHAYSPICARQKKYIKKNLTKKIREKWEKHPSEDEISKNSHISQNSKHQFWHQKVEQEKSPKLDV